jgi:predicted ATPase
MIKQISIQNFKSWRDTGEIQLAPLTAFFGTNSSGKSSLLQMLLLLKQTAESQDRGIVLRTGSPNDGGHNFGPLATLVHGDRQQMTLGLDWEIKQPLTDVDQAAGSTLSFSTQIFCGVGRNHVESMSYAASAFSASMVRSDKDYELRIDPKGKSLKRQQGRPLQHVSPPTKCYGFPDDALRLYQETGFLSDSVLELEDQLRRVYYLGPLREYPQPIYTWAGDRPANGVGLKGEHAVAALLAAKNEKVYSGKGNYKRKLEQMVAEWLVKLGMADSFETKPLVHGGVQYEVRLRRHTRAKQVLITDMGFGVSQVLPVLILCYYAPEGSTLILEQPEIHLHPSVQAGLADVFIDVMKRRKLQLIIESHSEHLLRRLQRRIAEQDTLHEKDVKLYFCDNVEGESTLTPLQLDMFGQIQNWPQGFFGDLTGDMLEMTRSRIERQQ